MLTDKGVTEYERVDLGPLSCTSFDAHMSHTAAKQKDTVAFEIDSKREGMPDLQKLFTSLYNYCSK